MKKLVLALIVALTLAPFSAFGLEMMTDNSLKDVTAQAGVAIAVDDVIIEQWIGATMYIDVDGVGTSDFGGDTSAGGAIVIGNRHKIMEINAIYNQDAAVSGTYFGLHDQQYSYSGNPNFIISPLTIDVGTCPTLTAGCGILKATLNAGYGAIGEANWIAAGMDVITHMNYSDFTGGNEANTNMIGVICNLPTVEIVTSSDTYSISAAVVNSADGSASATAASYHNSGDQFIRIHKAESAMGILGGRLEIAPK